MKKLLVLSLLSALAGGMPAYGAPLIVNEWNGVGENKVLASSGQDSFFNTNYTNPTGNGANWLELVVTQDHLDIRGWKLEWSNADPDSGDLVFTTSSLWSDLRSGTIITLRENDDGDAGNPVGIRASDVSFNAGGGDFWIEINVDDALYIVKNGFKTDNDDWQATIRDGSNTVVTPTVGENVGAWSGGGLASTEVASFQGTPTAGVILAGFVDLTRSSYGAPNWLNASGTSVQNFGPLRAWVPEPSSYVLGLSAACGAAAMVWRRRRGR